MVDLAARSNFLPHSRTIDKDVGGTVAYLHKLIFPAEALFQHLNTFLSLTAKRVGHLARVLRRLWLASSSFYP